MTDRSEDLLRETLQRRSAAPPPLPDLMEAVEARRTTQRRRTTVVASAAAVILAAGAISATLSLTSHPAHTSASPTNNPSPAPTRNRPTPPAAGRGVPFLPLPAGPAAAYTPWPTTSAHTTICTGADLQLHVITQQTVGAATTMQLAAQSSSDHICRLDRNTIGLGITANPTGPLLDAEPGAGIQPFWAVYPRVDPGASVLLDATWANWCGIHLSTAYPVLHPNTSITIRSDDAIRTPRCQHNGQPSDTSIHIDSVAQPGSTLTAAPSIKAPATARAGTTLHYTLNLTNPTDTPVPLDPCPTYTEELGNLADGSDPYRSTGTYRLNCNPIRSIAPHHTVAFQMQLPIPHKDAGHTLTLGWYWRGGEHTIQPQGTLHHATIHVSP